MSDLEKLLGIVISPSSQVDTALQPKQISQD
jgi:hypothetical protein